MKKPSKPIKKTKRTIDSPWYTMEEAAQYLNISYFTLSRIASHGDVVFRKQGNRKLFHIDDLKEYCKNQRVLGKSILNIVL